jgi:hypothetical protein
VIAVAVNHSSTDAPAAPIDLVGEYLSFDARLEMNQKYHFQFIVCQASQA